jgi:hypothetical protein
MVTSASRTPDARLAVVALLSILTAAACSPEISSGGYLCGPERYCPPEQACDEPTYTCVNAVVAEPFACPEDTEGFEPDDDLAGARDLGTMQCGQPLFGGGFNGCIAAPGKVDLFRLTGRACSGSEGARLGISLLFPIAFVPLQVELLDADGAVLATGVSCEVGAGYGGLDGVCLEAPVEDDVVYHVRVSVDPDGPDCDGGCAETLYILDIASVLT